jgi:hypothetical protein
VDAARAADPSLDGALRGASVRGRAIMRQQDGLARLMRGEAALALAELDASVDLARDGGERLDCTSGDDAARSSWRAARPPRPAWPTTRVATSEACAPRARPWIPVCSTLKKHGPDGLDRGALAAAAAHARESAAVLRDEPDPWFVSRALDTLAAVATAERGAPAAWSSGRAPRPPPPPPPPTRLMGPRRRCAPAAAPRSDRPDRAR